MMYEKVAIEVPSLKEPLVACGCQAVLKSSAASLSVWKGRTANSEMDSKDAELSESQSTL
jgi:hypothetical protein